MKLVIGIVRPEKANDVLEVVFTPEGTPGVALMIRGDGTMTFPGARPARPEAFNRGGRNAIYLWRVGDRFRVSVNDPGTYYGECNQICGVNHAFMPIEVKVLPKAEFDKWLADAKKKFAANPPAEEPGANPAEFFGRDGFPAVAETLGPDDVGGNRVGEVFRGLAGPRDPTEGAAEEPSQPSRASKR